MIGQRPDSAEVMETPKRNGENVECKLRKYFLETLEVEKKLDDEMENLEENSDLWYASMRKQLVD